MTTELTSGAELTSVSLTKDTRDMLKTFGMKGETYNAIVIRLMDNYAEEAE